MAVDVINIRFRSTSGDVGPFPFSETVLIQALKDKLFAEWPTEGPLAKEPPGGANDIKLILSGKYVDATKPLKEYRKDMGEVKADTLVTMHIVLRPAANPTKQQAAGSSQEKEPPKGGCCVIS